RRVDPARPFPLHGSDPAAGFYARIRRRHRVEERARVGMERIVEQLVAIREFDDAAEIHHGDALAEVPHQREIVSDEQVSEAEALAQILKQIDDLRLDRDVEGGYGLVADDEFGIERESARDPDRLALATRHL